MLTLLAYDHVINHLEITEIIFLAIKPELAVKKRVHTRIHSHLILMICLLSSTFLSGWWWGRGWDQRGGGGRGGRADRKEVLPPQRLPNPKELTEGRLAWYRYSSYKSYDVCMYCILYIIYIFSNIAGLQARKKNTFFPYIIWFAQNYSGIRKYFPSGLEVLPAGSTSSTLRGPLPPPSAHSTLTRLQVLLYVQEVLTHFSKLLLRLVRTSLTYST